MIDLLVRAYAAWWARYWYRRRRSWEAEALLARRDPTQPWPMIERAQVNADICAARARRWAARANGATT